MAALGGEKEVALFLINEVGCDINVKGISGWSLLHSACRGGNVSLVQSLIQDYKADINARDNENNTPLHVAALCGGKNVTLFLINEVGCDVNIRGQSGSLLNSACIGDNISLVRTLIQDHRVNTSAGDDQNNMPTHYAAMHGRSEILQVLIEEFGCDVNCKGSFGNSLLHYACIFGHAHLIIYLLEKMHTAFLVRDDAGNTPLHICSSLGHTKCVEMLLQNNAPILIRNNSGKTPIDLAKGDAKLLINEYMKQNRDKTLVDYHGMQEHAKKKYSGAQHITRLFIIGNPGAGKSSLVESLKREGFFNIFWRISESTVPPHTAGIIPSIHTSRDYGRVQFYDFAGDPEYYSSHAAILENLTFSQKGDNIFIIVIDLRKSEIALKKELHYWFTFIWNQRFEKKPHLIVVGSHLDLMTLNTLNKQIEIIKSFLKEISLDVVQSTTHFMVDCCRPGSIEISEVQDQISNLTSKSSKYELSFEASILLGLLEKDFSNVTACPVSILVSHIEDTGVHLPNKAELLHPILHELHEVGILLLIGDRTKHDYHIILNTSQLTNEVHEALFTKDAIQNIENMYKLGYDSSLKIGILPENLLKEILPPYITKESLIHLQYCQEIKPEDIRLFLSTSRDTSSSLQSFLFIPALCSTNKREVSWPTPPEFSYSIGWLAQCTDPYDYFPPRFLHVLLLRIVFRFTLTVPQVHAPSSKVELQHLQRRCIMWKTGVRWLMEEGVECMVEMVNINKGVVVTTKSEDDLIENCISVFDSIVSCVMETMKEFCHSIRPQFFLLHSTKEDEYLSEDNLFDITEVEEVLISAGGREVVISKTGKGMMKRTNLLCMRKLTHWNSLFPFDFPSILHHLKNLVRKLYDLGLELEIPRGVLEAIEEDYPTDTDRRRRELVRGWMNSSLDPPCWWHLVEALRKIDMGAIANEIEEKYSELL